MRSPYLRMAGPSSKGRTSLGWRGRSTRKWLVCSGINNCQIELPRSGFREFFLEIDHLAEMMLKMSCTPQNNRETVFNEVGDSDCPIFVRPAIRCLSLKRREDNVHCFVERVQYLLFRCSSAVGEFTLTI